MPERPKILIAVPAYRGVEPVCVASLCDLIKALTVKGVDHDIRLISIAGPDTARNVLASIFIQDASYTHLLFIDADMGFTPRVVSKLSSSGLPFVGAICPRRVEQPTEMKDFAVSGVRPTETPGIAQVDWIGMAITLIKREVFNKLLASGTIRCQQEHQYKPKIPIYGFFDPYWQEPRWLSEDRAFCDRWRTICGGKIYGLSDESITHVGTTSFVGKFSDFMPVSQQKS